VKHEQATKQIGDAFRIVVLSSCTGEKSVQSPDALTLSDFREGAPHVRKREAELADLLRPAEELYRGQQHVRLMRGVTAFRRAHPTHGKGPALDLRILSAGYGIVPGSQKLAPYEATFQGMGKAELRKWADTLGVPAAFRDAVAGPYDIALVLLGDDYLDACSLDASVKLGGPTLVFCGKNTLKKLPKLGNLHAVALTNAEAKRFSCGLVALKGELGSRILSRLAADAAFGATLSAASDVLTFIEEPTAPASGRRSPARAKTDVDYVISLPPSWRQKPHRDKLSYFIPEWDDLVDRDFDFETDAHSGGSGDWSNQVYAHQMFPEPNYDGMLISKVVAEKSKTKKERINRLGVHRFLRVPREFPIMGDCGAFGYINDKVPPYTTEEILGYYTRLDFDFGVSIDHLIVTATEADRKARYDLTVENAAEFLKQHQKAQLPWTPIGAVQGWDPKSYAAAASKYVSMGYKYIALGGLVRTTTNEILDVLRKVHEVVPAHVKVHLFGLARLNAMETFASLGVSSVDSASFLRRAWMGSGGQNYLTMKGEFFTAIRIPEAGKSFRAKRIVSDERASAKTVERLEKASLQAMRDLDRGKTSVDKVIDTLEEYDRLITPDRLPHRHLLQRTLEAQPWKHCPCDICRRDGIDVVIFRGNNRNRRRGFHNTYVFYRLLQQALAGEAVLVGRPGGINQPTLFQDDDADVDTGVADAV
jgi:queuine/archaeosine tRNA-ribosyltransferase